MQGCHPEKNEGSPCRQRRLFGLDRGCDNKSLPDQNPLVAWRFACLLWRGTECMNANCGDHAGQQNSDEFMNAPSARGKRSRAARLRRHCLELLDGRMRVEEHALAAESFGQS